MTDEPKDEEATTPADLLDQLEELTGDAEVSVGDVVEALGDRSFTALILVFALLAVSPASVVPGLTSLIGITLFLLAAQALLGRSYIWLPGFLRRRTVSGDKLQSGINWLRRPAQWLERVLKPRLTMLVRRPFSWLWLLLIMAIAGVMPFLELLPGAGSVAASVISCVAAALLTRDGALMILALAFLSLLLWLVFRVTEAVI